VTADEERVLYVEWTEIRVIGQQSVLLALLSCSSCSVKLHICSVIWAN